MEQELLYTQEDIDEWMKTCEELQESLREKRADIKKLEQENKQLKEQLAVLERALEFACTNIIHYEGDDEEEFCAKIDNAKNYFIEKAEKELKGEKDE